MRHIYVYVASSDILFPITIERKKFSITIFMIAFGES